MLVAKGDHVIFHMTLGKYAFAKVVAANATKAKIRFAVDPKTGESPPAEEIALDSIVANLGVSPKIGSIYGVKVEPCRVQTNDPYWGNLQYYVELDEKNTARFDKFLRLTAKELKQRGMPEPRTELHIRQQSGKLDGAYKARPKSETDIMTVRPRPDLDSMDFIIFHKYAYGLWQNSMMPKTRMRWLRAYNESIALMKIEESELENMRESLVSNGDVGGYFKELEDDDRKVFRAIIRHLKQVHNIERHHLQLMLTLQEDITEFWPSHVELSDKNVLLTDTATKNVEELFAESFAYHLTGRAIPKKLNLLLTETLSRLKK